MFEQIEEAPRDAILGLTEAFKNDSRDQKINLSVGVYQDEHGKTPLLECVAEAERRLAAAPHTKSYLPIPGGPSYRESVTRLLLGDATSDIAPRTAFAQTPGGTGALRVAGDFLHAVMPAATLWLSTPTWPNHPNIFAAAGVRLKNYPYFAADTNGLDLAGLLAAIESMPAGDVILLHGCCHNPTGIDLAPAEWTQVAAAIARRGVLPLLDFAYQGFAEGLQSDAVGLRALCDAGLELLVCNSFSKNFSLYRERVGALCAIAATPAAAQAVQSQINSVIRANYSNPPSHGAEIVDCVLRDDALRASWEEEVTTMRQRIHGMRSALVEALVERGVPGDYSFITSQRGMFSFSGLTPEQVDALQQQHAIYIVRSGRINVAGLTPANVARVADAIGEVVGVSA
jgi:aspartate/tyrosine/aromatic aminotransferase